MRFDAVSAAFTLAALFAIAGIVLFAKGTWEGIIQQGGVESGELAAKSLFLAAVCGVIGLVVKFASRN